MPIYEILIRDTLKSERVGGGRLLAKFGWGFPLHF